jgi:riboflavin-specific deaminase-like protein
MMTKSPKGRSARKKPARRRRLGTVAPGISPQDGFDAQAHKSWAAVPETFRAGRLLPEPWRAIFGPLQGAAAGGRVVLGQFGQSIDARIATAQGHSHYINGAAGLAHLHRLRALVDAVVVGVGTARADDPQLTCRHVRGPDPARVVIDPNGRLPAKAKLLADDGTRRLVITSMQAQTASARGVEIVRLPLQAGTLSPAAILAALAERGLRRILIEGGADTVSRFLAARCLDRLHVVIAPIIIGSGPSSVRLPPIARLEEALRAPMRAYVLGGEVLLDCDLRAQDAAVGVAKKST